MNIDRATAIQARIRTAAKRTEGSQQRVVRWQKMCACSGASQTNHIKVEHKLKGDVLEVTATLHPMLTCIECGKAWEQVPPNK